ncbi:MAG TPA: N-acetylmuramoyl-L-alanine amidase, partial [Candidatus Saccharimonadales bacterium]|nr:N-acetylmuramoyl-L-alanine amidase [Candidatus Saccharimonadales bacterium]
MRRRLRLASLIALFTLAFFPHGSAPALASPRVSGKVVAKELTHPAPARREGTLDAVGGALIAGPDAGSTGPGGQAGLVYTSPVLEAGQIFDRIGAHWVAAPGTEDRVHVELRSSADGVTWSPWRAADADEDMADIDKNEWYSSPWPAVPGARYAQYRLLLDGGDADAVRTIGITLLDVSDLNQSPVSRLLNDVKGALSDIARSGEAAAAVGATKILTRQDWGADETMMKWSPQYQKPHTKAVIHHTVTDDGGSNVAATIRTIYYFHAVTRGWGDIGYNYLVDKFGNIWTGRQGGDNVIGGHAYGWNDGAFGVAAIGDYTTVPPTSPLQYAIANVISLKFSQYGITNAFGADYFVHKEQRSDGVWVDVAGYPPNIQGHRNANYIVGQNGGQTECPGNQTYNMMDGLKRITQAALDAGYNQLAQLVPALPRGTFPGASMVIPTSVTNRGRTTIPAGTAVSYQVLLKGSVVQPQGGSATLPAALSPGASAIVNVPFTGPAAGDGYLVRWDLQTNGVWWNTLYNTPIRDMALRSTDWSANWVSDTVPAVWTAGETKTVTATVLNDGGRTWPAGGTNPVKLSYKWTSTSTGNAFPGAQLAPLAADVAPGQTVTVTFPVTAPAYPTNYSIRLDLTKVGEFNFGDRGIAPDDTTTAVLLDARATYAPTAVAFSSGQTATVPITITNTGAGVFPTTSAQPVNLGYHWSTASGTSVLWDGVRTKLPADLAPGASVQLQASVTAPPTGGTFTLRFDLVQEGVAWFSGKGNPT